MTRRNTADLQTLLRKLARRFSLVESELGLLTAKVEEDWFAAVERQDLFRELVRRECTLAEAGLGLMLAALGCEEGSRAAAARLLGISVRTVFNRLRALEVLPSRAPVRIDPATAKRRKAILALFRGQPD